MRVDYIRDLEDSHLIILTRNMVPQRISWYPTLEMYRCLESDSVDFFKF